MKVNNESKAFLKAEIYSALYDAVMDALEAKDDAKLTPEQLGTKLGDVSTMATEKIFGRLYSYFYWEKDSSSSSRGPSNIPNFKGRDI
jgi:hypothetical protein